MQSPTNAQIRAWARDNGLAVSARGRLPARVVEAYAAAHGGTPTAAEALPEAAATGTVLPADLAPAPPVAAPPVAAAAPAPPAPPAPVALTPTRRRWHARRTTSIAIGVVLALTLLGATAFLLLRNDEPAQRTAGTAGDVTFDDVRLGDCTAEIPEGVTLTVRVLPCDEPHEGEVYATFELSGEDYPGAADIERFALGGCQREAVAALPPDDETLYDLVYLAPSQQTWEQGDRTVSCVLSDPTGKPLVGSVVKGTARR